MSRVYTLELTADELRDLRRHRVTFESVEAKVDALYRQAEADIEADDLRLPWRAIKPGDGRGPLVAGQRNAVKTHCVRGHVYAGDNLRIGADGYRYCRACKAVYEARQRARRAGIPEKP